VLATLVRKLAKCDKNLLLGEEEEGEEEVKQ
jgi:hypothetical protein